MTSQAPPGRPDRLRRSSRDRVIFGVCGGLAEYFDVDPALVRVIFVILTFASGIGIIAYLALAVAVPSAASRSERQADTVRENVLDIADTMRGLGENARAALRSKGESWSQRRTALGGIILILIGAIFLLESLHVFNFLLGWLTFGKLWPVILIIIGIALLLRPRRTEL